MSLKPGDRVCQLYHSDGVPFWVRGYEVAKVSPFWVYVRRHGDCSKPLRLNKSLVTSERLVAFTFTFDAVYGLPYIRKDLVEVVNLKGNRAIAKSPEVNYIGRKCAGLRQSPLHNPFKMTSEGDRNRVCNFFIEKTLLPALVAQNDAVWDAFIDLVHQLIRCSELRLACWCAPARCHGHAIAHFAQRYAYSVARM